MAEDQSVSSNGLERPATVFLSYAHEDAEFVKDLQLRLNIRGVRSWRDVDDLMSGSPFEAEIVQAIHLFAAIPAELAVLIGHQLNALCPITLYEFDRMYKPVGTLQ